MTQGATSDTCACGEPATALTLIQTPDAVMMYRYCGHHDRIARYAAARLGYTVEDGYIAAARVAEGRTA